MIQSDTPLSIVIIDNDPSLSVKLVKAIESYPGKIESLNSFHDPLSAVRSLSAGYPDLIFLNIDSKGYHGLDVLRLLPPGIENRIIYVADQEKVGTEAVKLGARGYVLKPIKDSEIHIILDHLEARKRSEKLMSRTYLRNKLLIKKQDRAIIINLDDILYMEADGPYTHFHMINNYTVKSSKTLGYYLKLLSDLNNLIKINRSYVVNFDYIKEVINQENGARTLVLTDNQEIHFSNNSKNRLIHGIQEIINNSIRG